MFIQVIPTSTVSRMKLQISQALSSSRGFWLVWKCRKGNPDLAKTKNPCKSIPHLPTKLRLHSSYEYGCWLEDPGVLTLDLFVWIRKAAIDNEKMQRREDRKLSILNLSWLTGVNSEGKNLRLAKLPETSGPISRLQLYSEPGAPKEERNCPLGKLLTNLLY